MKDNLAVVCSGLCLVHCLITPVLLVFGVLGTFSSWLESEWIHVLFLVPVIVLAVLSLPVSYLQHGSAKPMYLALAGIVAMISSFFFDEVYELWITIPSAWLIISAHLWNKWLSIKQTIVLEPANG